MSWSEILGKHRDWTRDGVLYYAVRHGRLRLVDVVKRLKGMKDQAGAQAVKRFRQAMEAEGKTEQKDFVEKLRRNLDESHSTPQQPTQFHIFRCGPSPDGTENPLQRFTWCVSVAAAPR